MLTTSLIANSASVYAQRHTAVSIRSLLLNKAYRGVNTYLLNNSLVRPGYDIRDVSTYRLGRTTATLCTNNLRKMLPILKNKDLYYLPFSEYNRYLDSLVIRMDESKVSIDTVSRYIRRYFPSELGNIRIDAVQEVEDIIASIDIGEVAVSQSRPIIKAYIQFAPNSGSDLLLSRVVIGLLKITYILKVLKTFHRKACIRGY